MKSDVNEMVEVVRSLDRVCEWRLNPRGGKYEGMAELKESLQEVGLQDAIHVWVRADGDYLLKGHRRFRAMTELGWSECRMLVHDFGNEAEAYLYLLQDHGHTVSLNSDEKLVAMMNGVKLGMTVAELAPALGVTEERAQMWFDLGEGLPPNGHEALASGAMSMNVAELVLQVGGMERRREAVQMVLRDSITNEPMGFSAAKNFITATYILPERWRKAWAVTAVKLKRKYKPAEGFHFVEWADRSDFVMGESGQPQPEYEYGDSMVSRGGELWMTKAQTLGVPVYVVPAPRHADEFVMVVHRKMIRDAEGAQKGRGEEESGGRGEEEKSGAVEEEKRGGGEEGKDESKPENGGRTMAETDDAAAALGRWLRVMLGAIYECLSAQPTVVMTYEPWKPLYEFLSHLTTDVDAGAAEAWLGVKSREELMAWMGKDIRARAPLRLTLMLLLCAESDASAQPQKVITAVAEALGLDVAELGRMAGE